MSPERLAITKAMDNVGNAQKEAATIRRLLYDQSPQENDYPVISQTKDGDPTATQSITKAMGNIANAQNDAAALRRIFEQPSPENNSQSRQERRAARLIERQAFNTDLDKTLAGFESRQTNRATLVELEQKYEEQTQAYLDLLKKYDRLLTKYDELRKKCTAPDWVEQVNIGAEAEHKPSRFGEIPGAARKLGQAVGNLLQTASIPHVASPKPANVQGWWEGPRQVIPAARDVAQSVSNMASEAATIADAAKSKAERNAVDAQSRMKIKDLLARAEQRRLGPNLASQTPTPLSVPQQTGAGYGVGHGAGKKHCFICGGIHSRN